MPLVREAPEKPCVFKRGEVVLCREPDSSRPKLLHEVTIMVVQDMKDLPDQEPYQTYVVHFKKGIYRWNCIVSHSYLLKDNLENRLQQKLLAKEHKAKLEQEEREMRELMTHRRPPVGNTPCVVCTCYGGKGPCNPNSTKLKRKRLDTVSTENDSSDSSSDSSFDSSNDSSSDFSTTSESSDNSMNEDFYKVLKADRKRNKKLKVTTKLILPQTPYALMKKKMPQRESTKRPESFKTKYILKLVTVNNKAIEKSEPDVPRAVWISQDDEDMSIFDVQKIIDTYGTIQSLVIIREVEKPVPRVSDIPLIFSAVQAPTGRVIRIMDSASSSNFDPSKSAGPQSLLSSDIRLIKVREQKNLIKIGRNLWKQLERDAFLIKDASYRVRLPADVTVINVLETCVKEYITTMIETFTEEQDPGFEGTLKEFNALFKVADGLRIYFDFCFTDHILYEQEKRQYNRVNQKYNFRQPTTVSSWNDIMLECFDVEDCIELYDDTAEAPTKRTTTRFGNYNKALDVLREIYCTKGVTRSDFMRYITGWSLVPEEFENLKLPSSVYGVNHLIRLFVKLPEFLQAIKIENLNLGLILDYISVFVKYLEKKEDLFGDSNYNAPISC